MLEASCCTFIYISVGDDGWTADDGPHSKVHDHGLESLCTSTGLLTAPHTSTGKDRNVVVDLALHSLHDALTNPH